MPSHLYELAQQRAECYPEAIAFGGQDDLIWRSITSAQALTLIEQLAEELGQAGVAEGDRVVLWVPNHWQTPVYLFALWKLGAVAVPFDREMNPEAGARIIESVTPALILSGYGERPAWAGTSVLTEWWQPGSRGGRSGDESWTHPAEELAAIFFTSGTTGTPKGCMITHANLCTQVEALRYTIPLDPSCRLASILPLSHLFELTVGMLYPFSMGAAVHYIPSRRGPDIVRVLREQRITHMIAVPQLLALMGQTLDQQLSAKMPAPVYRMLNATAARLPLRARHRLFWIAHRKLGGQLRMLASGGAALPVETQQLWERLGVRVVQGYGASECSPVIACGSGDGSTPLGSVGRPIRDVQVRQTDDGELLVSGPNLMRGYWNDPSRTAEVLRDGWYSTSDIGSFDSRGNLTLSGRVQDLIVLPSGLKVWPQDVEDVLRSDPAVADVSVIAVPAVGGGATLHAYLLPDGAAGRRSDVATIVSRANGRLAQHQRIASASWWPDSDFPRTAIGKVRRNLLPPPERAASVAVDAAQAGDDPVGQAIAGVARVPAVQDSQTLAELGLDSFGLVELSLALEEKTGRALGDGDLSTEFTVAQVRALIAGTAAAGGGHGRSTGRENGEQPLWPYTWGRIFRMLGLPFEGIYRIGVTETIVLGGHHLRDLPERVIFAGTHHSFADMPLVRHALARTPARRLVGRLVIAAAARGWIDRPVLAMYCRLAFGLYPLRQTDDRDASLRGLARLAGAGNPVLIFPQGMHAEPEREREGDAAVQFRPGVAHLAAALGAPVVPFGIAGTERLMPAQLDAFHGRVIAGIPVSIKRGPLAIAFGEPLKVERGELPHAFAARLQQASYALTRDAEQALGGHTEADPVPPPS